jgi:hypothetical protein
MNGAFPSSTGNWNFLIKVPAGSVAAYQAASGWSAYADYIVALDN